MLERPDLRTARLLPHGSIFRAERRLHVLLQHWAHRGGILPCVQEFLALASR